MIEITRRSEADGLKHHQANPVRVYSEDEIQKVRIERSVAMCIRALQSSPFASAFRIIEIGCGCADIGGALSQHFGRAAHVIGVDCNAECLAEARKRYPRLETRLSAIAPILLNEYRLSVLCEVLEHMSNPSALAAGILSKSQLSVVSHPLDEDPGSCMSGGDHQWAFSMADHLSFFDNGGHVIDETDTFKMGYYTIVLSRGHRVCLT